VQRAVRGVGYVCVQFHATWLWCSVARPATKLHDGIVLVEACKKLGQDDFPLVASILVASRMYVLLPDLDNNALLREMLSALLLYVPYGRNSRQPLFRLRAHKYIVRPYLYLDGAGRHL